MTAPDTGKYSGRGMGKNAQHSSATDDHGTPVPFVELARRALGGIDLDPASDSYWNFHTVKAARFYDERLNGLVQPWRGRLWINPPGARKDPKTNKRISSSKVSEFWKRLIDHYVDGRVDSAVWMGYSLEQLPQLQSHAMHPLQFVTLVPTSRIDFLKRSPSGGPPTANGSPTHGSFLTLLPTRASRTHASQQLRAFVEGAQALDVGGALIRPL